MRIGFLADEIAPGSAPVIIGHAIRGLRKLGHDAQALVIIRKDYQKLFPEIFSHYLRGDVPIQYIMDRLPKFFTKYNFKFPGFSFFSMHHISSGLGAPFVFKKKELDIIVANCHYTSFAARPLSAFKKIPYVLRIWDPPPYTLKKVYSNRKMKYAFPLLYPLSCLLEHYAYGGARAIITSGKLHHEYLRKITKKNLEILYPGCYPLEKLPDFKSREEMILTFDRWDIGNIPNQFLDILHGLKKKVKLVIGGFWHPASLKDSFVDDVKRRGLEDQVEIVGPLGEKQIYDLCSKAMLHIHPNEEAFGMQSLEAAACGCPIIIPRGSGVTELFEHGRHGYFPEKNNVSEIIKYTNMIFDNPNKAEQMSLNVWNAAKKNTWQHYANQLESIVKKYSN